MSRPAEPASARKLGVSAVKRSGSSSSDENLLAHEIGERHLRRRNHAVAGVLDHLADGIARLAFERCGDDLLERVAGEGPELVVLEFRQLRRAEHGVVANEQRRVHFRVAVLVRVQVDHELTERALQPREAAFEHHEARARELRRRLEIHEPQSLAELEMLLGAVERRRLSGTVTLHVAVLVCADRHVLLGNIGDGGKSLEQSLLGDALGLFQLRHRFLDPRNVGHQLLRPRLVLLRLGLADLLGEGIAALGGCLQGGDGALALVVEADQLSGQGLHAPVPEALIERRGIVADGTDVVHGMRTCFVRRPCPSTRPPLNFCQGRRPMGRPFRSPTPLPRARPRLPHASSRPCGRRRWMPRKEARWGPQGRTG